MGSGSGQGQREAQEVTPSLRTAPVPLQQMEGSKEHLLCKILLMVSDVT